MNLRPYPKYKDSSVAWLGQVPEGWEVKRSKSVSHIRYGLGQPPKEKEDGLPLIRATNVDHGKIVVKDLLRININNVPASRNAVLSEGEIIVVRSGAYTADSAIVPKEFTGSVAGYDMVMTVFKAMPEYVALALLSKYLRDDQLIQASMRAAQPHLNKEELGSSLIILPQNEEQEIIVLVTEKKLNALDLAISRIEREISLMQEYRTRLISDVVTGKTDVRDIAIPDIADIDDTIDESIEEPEGEEALGTAEAEE
ncbi:MAG: Type I restriction-modification system, specificity subunit S [Candidatus Jettenia ecosi]|uniref:Type I restriction-modification system, specificity subunit S n=1 Tax=Candidatus Jettenia ecosi TaxID=2494326 RepID=A0A533Q802_9BACT|nr:MAG: Type I restriction-modification system, specificity subunit S [Candidatus Jettenia ecosi]